MKLLSKFFFAFFILTFIGIYGPGTIVAQTNEYMVQTVFSEKFTRFISWPEGSKVHDTLQPFTICIAGKTESSKYFLQLFKDNKKKIKNKDVVVILDPKMDDIAKCDLLYFGKAETEEIKKILTKTEGNPILTITEADIPNKNSVIYFYRKDNKILFNINTAVAKKQHLKISHMLLNLCKNE